MIASLPEQTIAAEVDDMRRVILITILGLMIPAWSAVRAEVGAVSCDAVHVPVSLDEGLPADQWIYAELCVPHGAMTVHLLVTPAVTNHRFWDPPFEPERYSYVRALNDAGYATLNIDPIAGGQSSHPFSALVTMDAYVLQVHQLVQQLRAGAIGGRAFSRVVSNGMSNGAVTALLEAARYGDVDAVVAMGMSVPVNAVGLGAAAATAVKGPAFLDPRFAGRGLDPGYVVFSEDFHRRAVLSPDGYDPRLVAALASVEDTITVAYLANGGFRIAQSVSLPVIAEIPNVRVPVLIALGQQDAFMCGTPPLGTDCSSAATVRASNAAMFAGTPRLDAFVLPRAGHDLNLAINAPEFFAQVVTWTGDVLGA